MPTPGPFRAGDEYHGCLRIDVRRSSDLYRRIEGWSTAIMADA